MSTAVIATQMQLQSALQILASTPPSNDEHYLWAAGFLTTNLRTVLTAIRDPRERTALATAARHAAHENRRRRAVELRAEGVYARVIGQIIATEEGHPETPYSERSVCRWR